MLALFSTCSFWGALKFSVNIEGLPPPIVTLSAFFFLLCFRASFKLSRSRHWLTRWPSGLSGLGLCFERLIFDPVGVFSTGSVFYLLNFKNLSLLLSPTLPAKSLVSLIDCLCLSGVWFFCSYWLSNSSSLVALCADFSDLRLAEWGMLYGLNPFATSSGDYRAFLSVIG